MLAAHEKKFLHALALAGAEPDALQKISSAFGSFETAWRAGLNDLVAAGASPEAAAKIAAAHERVNPDDEMRKLVAAGIVLVSSDEAEYPPELRDIAAPPLALYIKGRIPPAPRLAVVGTRKATAYGREATHKLIRDLAAETRLVIVSGLAQGIDAEAHKAALASGLPTVGALGSGMDRASFFPPENWNLAEEIVAKGGAVISEYPPGAPALQHHFPARNRIIAGLSSGVLVVEAPERSGALITARLALEQGRDVLAVPGPMFSPNAIGTHRLIQDGAALVTQADNIITALNLPRRPRAEQTDALLTNAAERTILTLLGDPASVDEIKEKTNMPTPEIISCLSLLELKGFVRPMGQNRFQRIS